MNAARFARYLPLLFLALLAAQDKPVAGDRKLDVLWFETWQLGGDPVCLLVLGDIDDRRGKTERTLLAEHRIGIEHVTQ